jgi:hypothetical protein
VNPFLPSCDAWQTAVISAATINRQFPAKDESASLKVDAKAKGFAVVTTAFRKLVKSR